MSPVAVELRADHARSRGRDPGVRLRSSDRHHHTHPQAHSTRRTAGAPAKCPVARRADRALVRGLRPRDMGPRPARRLDSRGGELAARMATERRRLTVARPTSLGTVKHATSRTGRPLIALPVRPTCARATSSGVSQCRLGGSPHIVAAPLVPSPPPAPVRTCFVERASRGHGRSPLEPPREAADFDAQQRSQPRPSRISTSPMASIGTLAPLATRVHPRRGGEPVERRPAALAVCRRRPVRWRARRRPRPSP